MGGIWYKQGVVITPTTGDLNGGVSFSGTSNPFVLYETNPQLISPNADGKVFKMYFGGANNTYYAESNTALPGSWTRSSTVLATGFGGPWVIHTGGIYYMYVCPEPTVFNSVKLYTCTDNTGINFVSQGTILSLGTSGAWDAGQLFYFRPFHFDGTTWYANYLGANPSSGGPYAIGIATSTDLVSWTKYASNPVMTTTSGVIGLDIHLVGSTYYGWAQVQDTPGATLDPCDIGIVSSTSITSGWTVPSIIFPRTFPNEGVGLANGEVAAPSLVEVNGVTYMFYTGSPTANVGTGYQVMLAIAYSTIAEVAASSQGVAFTFVQSPTPNAFGSHTSYAQAFASNNTLGNLLICSAYMVQLTDSSTILDSQGNTWTALPVQQFAGAVSGANTLKTWYALNCKSGANTVTVSVNSVAVNGSIMIAEYSGANGEDKNAGTVGSSTSLNSGSTAMTTQPNELLIGVVANFNGGISAPVLGPGGLGQITNQNVSNAWELIDNVVVAEGTYSITATGTNGGWAAQVATFYNAFTITGNAGIAGATVTYSGPVGGSVTADGSGNYTINGTLNGSYTITPSKSGHVFSPTFAVETVTGSSITGVNFSAALGGSGGLMLMGCGT